MGFVMKKRMGWFIGWGSILLTVSFIMPLLIVSCAGESPTQCTKDTDCSASSQCVDGTCSTAGIEKTNINDGGGKKESVLFPDKKNDGCPSTCQTSDDCLNSIHCGARIQCHQGICVDPKQIPDTPPKDQTGTCPAS